MAALHGWQPRLGTGLNNFRNNNNGQILNLTNVPTEVTLEGTPFSPEIMNELEQAIANSEILSFDAAPTSGTPGALGQFGTYGGMVYYCTGVSISMSYGSIQPGTYYFYAQNLPYSFTLSAQQTGLSFDGATLTAGGQAVPTNCWPQGTEITLTDSSTYQWTPLQPAASTVPISDALAHSLNLPSNSTIADALGKMTTGLFLDDPAPSLLDMQVFSFPSAGNVISFGYGNGVYLAGTDSGAILTSQNGNTWSLYTTSPAGISGLSINGIAYANGLFLAACGAQLLKSSDGYTWETVASAPSGTWVGVAFLAGLWIIGGTSGIYTSPDLTQWTQRSTNPVQGLVGTSNAAYTVASSGGASGVQKSTDGIAWSLITSSYTGAKICADDEGNIVVNSSNQNIAYFYNGSSWSTADNSEQSAITGAFLMDGTPYLLSTNGVVLSFSPIKSISTPDIARALYSALPFGGHLVIGGASGTILVANTSGQIVDGSGNPVTNPWKKLLWTGNQNVPADELIPLDLSGYDQIEMFVTTALNGFNADDTLSLTIPVGKSGRSYVIGNILSSGSILIGYRIYETSANGVTPGQTYQKFVNASGRGSAVTGLDPVAIYGVKL